MVEPDALSWLFLSPWGWVVAALWGALWGSFFNVMIVRLPSRESVVRPASHCRSCGAPIRWWDNIPIVSYLLLRGRCRRCGARFSARYLLVELLVCGLAVLLYYALVVSGPGPLPLRLGQFVITSLFAGTLVAITFIDLELYKIPDAITYPGIPLCVLLSLFMGLPHQWDGLLGAIGGYLVIRLVADGYQLLTGRLGMGYGDAKLLAMIGGLLGWQVLLPTLFLASLQGSLIGITALVILRRRQGQQTQGELEASPEERRAPGREPAAEGQPAKGQGENEQDEKDEEAQEAPASLRLARIPFGPFLSLAALEVLLLRDALPAFFPYFF